jgi:hypothetical protein
LGAKVHGELTGNFKKGETTGGLTGNAGLNQLNIRVSVIKIKLKLVFKPSNIFSLNIFKYQKIPLFGYRK